MLQIPECTGEAVGRGIPVCEAVRPQNVDAYSAAYHHAGDQKKTKGKLPPPFPYCFRRAVRVGEDVSSQQPYGQGEANRNALEPQEAIQFVDTRYREGRGDQIAPHQESSGAELPAHSAQPDGSYLPGQKDDHKKMENSQYVRMGR